MAPHNANITSAAGTLGEARDPVAKPLDSRPLQRRAVIAGQPLPSTPPSKSATAKRRSRQFPLGDDLAVARAVKAQQRASVEQTVESRMEQLAREAYQVPWLYVEITGNLPAASALCVIERCSEQARLGTGSGWVHLPLQRWMNFTGLFADQWLAARQELRELGVTRERRTYDLAAGEIVTQIAFVTEAFAQEVAKLRDAFKDAAWQALKAKAAD